jgi:hypothetical protein
MLLGNVKTAECLIFVALHEKPVSMWRFEATGIKGENGLEKEPDSSRLRNSEQEITSDSKVQRSHA